MSSDGTERCIYCDKEKFQHPVHDDNGGLACSGMESWWGNPEDGAWQRLREWAETTETEGSR